MGIELQIAASTSTTGDAFDPLLKVLQSLKDLPEFPFDVFYSLVFESLEHLSVSIDSPALGAGHLRGVVGPGRHLELIIAALTALDTYLHRFNMAGTENERE
ncbi:MAG: hypothetical protein WBI95_15135 [Pseudomonas veronii]